MTQKMIVGMHKTAHPSSIATDAAATLRNGFIAYCVVISLSFLGIGILCALAK